MAGADAPPRRRPRKRLPIWAVPVLIVATLGAAELAAGFIGPHIPRTAGTEERLLIKSDQVYSRGGSTDVVVLGSSETAGGAIPSDVAAELSGLDGVYNAALAGSEPTVMTEWAERVVVPNLDPQVAVIGILPMTVMAIDQTGADNPLAAIEAYESAIDQVDPGGFSSWGWRFRQESNLIRYRPYLRSPVDTAEGLWRALGFGDDDEAPAEPGLDWTTETDPDRVADATGPDGEVFDYRQPSVPLGPEGDPVGAAIYTRFSEADTDFAGLDALVAALRAQGVTPVVAIAPVDRAPLEAAGADLSRLDAVAAEVQAWGEANDVAVNDQFTQAWDPALFHDRNHLAEAGAQAWSAELGRWLSQLCATDRLGDACQP